jgi:hypothetical protein
MPRDPHLLARNIVSQLPMAYADAGQMLLSRMDPKNDRINVEFDKIRNFVDGLVGERKLLDEEWKVRVYAFYLGVTTMEVRKQFPGAKKQEARVEALSIVKQLIAS